jgi:hypothetical protein
MCILLWETMIFTEHPSMLLTQRQQDLRIKSRIYTTCMTMVRYSSTLTRLYSDTMGGPTVDPVGVVNPTCEIQTIGASMISEILPEAIGSHL